MNNYKDKFYDRYVSTHVVPRKGEATLGEFKSRTKAYQKLFGKFLPKDKSSKIIDLGCGNGSVLWWLQQAGFTNAHGIDISDEQIKVALKLGVKNVKQSGIKEVLRESKDLYDLVFIRDTLEHFNKADIAEILSLSNKSLKEGGMIIIQVPNAESPFGNRLRYGDFTHEIAFTKSSLSQVLRMAGFNRIEYCPVEPIISGMKSLIRYLLWKIVEKFYLFLLFAEIGKGKRLVTQDIIAAGLKDGGTNFLDD